VVLVVSLVAAGLLWRRGTAPSPSTASPFAGLPAPALPPPGGRPSVPTPRVGLPPPGGRASVPTPQGVPNAAAEEWSSGQSQVTPAVGNPMDILGAAPEAVFDQGFSGRVEIALARSGSVSLSPGELDDEVTDADNAEADPRVQEYRALFLEFVKLRRTTGESNEGLNVDHFVDTLRRKRAELMKQAPVKDVRFKLAFQNGKAAIRYLTVT
jgi:hypothetical protein